MTEINRTIPCGDCALWKHDLELTGYHVIGCDHSGPAGMCTLRYTDDKGIAEGIGPSLFAAPVKAVNAAAAAPVAAAAAGAAPNLAKKAAEAIVNIFETGSVLGDYSAVTLIQHDSGHLTYGRSQTTLGSGNLYLLIKLYCGQPGARLAAKLNPYLQRLKDKDTQLDQDVILKNALRAAADDKVMRFTQDDFFDSHYWQTAAAQANQSGISTALGIAVVYDSVVHGSWDRMRDRTSETKGSINALGEKKWVEAYLNTRRDWMANHARPDIRKTVYRMDSLLSLVKQGAWDLGLPLVVRGEEISVSSLAGTPKGCFDGPEPGSRDLAVQATLLRGADVRLMQLAIGSKDIQLAADGIFGQATASAVTAFQKLKGEMETGSLNKAAVVKLAQAALA